MDKMNRWRAQEGAQGQLVKLRMGCFVINAYYMGWFVCTVNAVRVSHSAIDLRTCTDAD